MVKGARLNLLRLKNCMGGGIAMIKYTQVLTGWIAESFGQVRFFARLSDAREWARKVAVDGAA